MQVRSTWEWYHSKRPCFLHQVLHILKFFILILNFKKDIKVICCWIQKSLHSPLVLRRTACMETFLPICRRLFIWWKNPPQYGIGYMPSSGSFKGIDRPWVEGGEYGHFILTGKMQARLFFYISFSRAFITRSEKTIRRRLITLTSQSHFMPGVFLANYFWGPKTNEGRRKLKKELHSSGYK
jgi:hypothetical protein